MSYNNKIYKIANQIMEEKRDRNKAILEKRKEEVLSLVPSYKELKKELINLMGQCLKNIGNNGENSYDIELIKEKISANEQKRISLLIENGFPRDYLDDLYDCKECKDTGYILNKQCSCYQKLLHDISYKESNIPNILELQNFDEFDINVFSSKKGENNISPRDNMKNILNHVKVFVDNFESVDTKSLLFTGSTGVGKTYLSSCIAKYLIDKGYNVFYQSAGKLCEILDEYKFNRDSNDYDICNIIKMLYDVDVLIIDDLGTEFRTSYTLSAIYELINSRIINNKKMIVSTNLSVIDLKEVYTERLFSRFLGEFNILEFIGEDIRAKKILDK